MRIRTLLNTSPTAAALVVLNAKDQTFEVIDVLSGAVTQHRIKASLKYPRISIALTVDGKPTTLNVKVGSRGIVHGSLQYKAFTMRGDAMTWATDQVQLKKK